MLQDAESEVAGRSRHMPEQIQYHDEKQGNDNEGVVVDEKPTEISLCREMSNKILR